MTRGLADRIIPARLRIAMRQMPRACRALLAAAALAALFAPAASAATPPGSTQERGYDLAAQDLEAALLAFGRTSGIDIVYDSAILRGLRSAPLKGRFAPPIAVATLLRGSPLVHRFTSATAVLIVRAGADRPSGSNPDISAPLGRAQLTLNRLRVTAGLIIGKPPVDYRPFGQIVQGTIMRRLQDSPVQARRFQARLAVRIDDQGMIRPLGMQAGSGDAQLDKELLRILNGLALPEVPPAGMPQPIWFEIVQR